MIDRHLRFRGAAVRAQPVALQPRQVVVLGRAADAPVLARNDGDVALAVGRHLEHAAGRVAVERELDAFGTRHRVDDLVRAHRAARPDAHEAAERAVVRDEGVGDRADHGRRAGARAWRRAGPAATAPSARRRRCSCRSCHGLPSAPRSRPAQPGGRCSRPGAGRSAWRRLRRAPTCAAPSRSATGTAARAGARRSSLMPASSTSSDSSIEYMPGCSMPSQGSTF